MQVGPKGLVVGQKSVKCSADGRTPKVGSHPPVGLEFRRGLEG